MRFLVTGGAGFIGSEFVRQCIPSNTQVTVLDKLTYAGNLENLAAVKDSPALEFVHGDICDREVVERVIRDAAPDVIVHFAAESHVDRSINSPLPAIQTNVNGTFTLLEAARQRKVSRFVHVSTDEVYGSIEPPLEADETYPLNASSPYSASKAGSDLLALSYWKTYGMPVLVTRASNNYGPYQFPEKLIPLMINNALQGRSLPVYGDGSQIRDWLHVTDHCRAVRRVLDEGQPGEIYNVGGSCSLTNLEVVQMILESTGQPQSLIDYVKDRPGHDRRYALSSGKIFSQLGWKPIVEFREGLHKTIEWYRNNPKWLSNVLSGEYQNFYSENYGWRTAEVSR